MHGTGAITGIVDGAGGQPLTAACVVASGQGRKVLAVTTSDGRYTLTGLKAGSYTVTYSGCAAGGAYADSSARASIAAGQVRPLATVRLRPGVPSASAPAMPSAIPGLTPQVIAASASGQAGKGTGAIAGTVTGGGKPVSGVCVFVFGSSSGHTVTSEAGKYRIAKLRAGKYEVVFLPTGFCGNSKGNWLEQVYKGLSLPIRHGKPTRVPVKAGKTTSGIDAALRLGGEITGTVKSKAGKTQSRVCVQALGRQGKTLVGEGFGTSGKNGEYALHSLPPGTYTVAFIPRNCGNKGNFIPQWWRNSGTLKGAEKITIKSGLIVGGIDGALAPGGVINGVVRGGSTHGAPLKGVCVFAQPVRQKAPFFEFFRVITNKSGAYRLSGLTTGKYRLLYSRGCGAGGNFLTAKRSVSAVAGHTTNGVDTFLPAGAIIKGKVTDTHGNPVPGICVAISGHAFSSARTAADGTYSAIALPSGSYKVFFFGGCKSTGSFAPQYYRGQVNSGSADPVTATAGHVTGGISVVMQPGATITGVVTDSTGTRLSKVCVEVQTPSEAQEGFPYGDILQTKNGVYTVRNLVPGDYAVEFGCPYGRNLFASQWFRGQSSQGSSDLVSAPAGLITSGVSAVMRSGGSIAGRVTSSAGQGLSGICVEVFPPGGPVPGVERFFYGQTIAFTNRQGDYHLSHLAVGKYDVEFGCDANRFASQWYKGTAARASATPVAVVSKTTTTGINAVLAAGGTISGVVTIGGGQPQGRVCVEASDAEDASFRGAFTDKQGRYSLKQLSSGSYQITFFDCGFGRGHVRLGTAILPALVKLVAPHSVTVAAEKLSPAGSISGTVLGGPGATPQSGVCVVAVADGPNAAAESAETNPSGTYKLGALAPGKYKVYLGDPTCLLTGSTSAPQWYQGKSSQASATVVKVTAGVTTAGVDATLGVDGTITGTVATSSHKAVTGACVTATPVSPVPDPLSGAVSHAVVAISSGSYVLAGLVPGKYTVEFSAGCGASGFGSQWWHNAGSAGQATVITVPASTTVSGISATVH